MSWTGRINWTPEMDRMVLDGIASSAVRRLIAAEIGVSTGAVTGRYVSLTGKIHPARLKRKIDSARRRYEQEARTAKILADLDADLKNGVSRRLAYRLAVGKGIKKPVIERHLGLGRNAVWWAINRGTR